MSFFDSLPPPEPDEPEPPAPPRPAWDKPEDMFGGVVPDTFLLARGAGAALGLSGIVAYPNGFSFTVTVVMSREDRHGGVFHHAFHRDTFAGEPLSADFLRLGVQFADGSAATNLGGHPRSRTDEPTGPLLMHDGGGGGGRRYDMTYWIWPLPPPGPVAFICEWPAHGIPDSRAELDAQQILDAATRTIPLLPESD
ncbi:hypothetical protein OHA21_08515 [Actinoplanes sp. NBC_00393]|uniref:hypothetical protein n=1 Tax=Actinoplanes sp. NBC_00393 TaxID=2975953 RepID=UPI002E1DA10B